MATRKNFRERRQLRREQAEERQAARDKRGDKQQLADLELGLHGNGREAARLRKKLNA